MSSPLEQIDRQLIELIAQRITYLSCSSEPGAASSEVNQLLAQAGVPEFVWQDLLVNCVAASATAACPPSLPSRQVTVIGGGGQMGRFFVEQLISAGHKVKVLGRNGWDGAEALLGQADLVLVSVPLGQTEAIIAQAAPYLKSTTALVDVASIKAPIVEAMLIHHSGPVVGLHPMFGPGVESFLSQNVVVCPGRQPEVCQWFLDFIASRGGKLIWCTSQEHDQMMAIVQAIRHFTTFSLGAFLAAEGIDLARTLEFASPLYRVQLDLVSRLFAQDPSLYLNVMLTAERPQAISRLAATYCRLAQMVENNDRAALTQEFAQASRFFQHETCRALEESNFMIDSLSKLLAANRTGDKTKAASPAPKTALSATFD